MNEQSIAESRIWGWAAGLAAALGVALRVRALLGNRSLWLDEAMLALNICGRSFAGLWAPLDLDQGAPIGFLMLERLAVVLLGPTELALRLAPFVASIASLALVYRFCRANLGMAAAAIGLLLVSLSPALISYSGEAKQYAVDVAVGLFILTVGSDALRVGLSGRRALAIAVAGILAVWLSHPAVFMLAGVGTTLIVTAAIRRQPATTGLAIVVSTAWLVSFAALYVVSLKQLNANPNLNAYWEEGFLPFPPLSAAAIRQYIAVALGVFEASYQNTHLDERLSERMGLIAAAAYVIGLLTLLRRESRTTAALLAAPIGFAILAALAHKYPLRARLALFVTGPILLTSAAGLVALIRSDDKTRWMVGRVLLGSLVALPALQAARYLFESRAAYGARTVLEQVARDWQPGDLVLIDGCSGPPFRWYQTYGRIPGLDRVVPTACEASLCDPVRLVKALPTLKGQSRVWLVVSDHSRNSREVELVELTLDHWGKRIETAATTGFYAQLYDFRSREHSVDGPPALARESTASVIQ